MRHSSYQRTYLVAIASAATLCGCEDLGECNDEAARQLVYGRNGLVATKGQALAHDSCGNAAFCHSESAYGAERHGAPFGMNFDMLPEPSGRDSLFGARLTSWKLVRKDEMPPRGPSYAETVGDGDWRYSAKREDGSTKLPAIDTPAGKAIFRNWLACGAPVAAETRVPDWALDPGDAGATLDDWTGIHAQVIEPNCALGGCHVSASAAGAGGLDLGNLCEAYAALSQAGSCGEVRATPGDASSFLLEKMEQAEPSCGNVMPTTGALPKALTDAVRAWVEAGMPAADCE